jgi:hypothetical protein
MRESNHGGGVPAGQPPSEAWLFAQELLGNPVPASAGHDLAAELEYREWLAQISPRHEEALRKRRHDEHELRRKREHLEWLAAVSKEHEATLRDFLQQEAKSSGELQAHDQYAEEQWDPAKHPRRGGPPNAGWFAGGGGGGGAGGSDAAATSAPNEASATASATPEMLELARAWWHTNEALEQAKRELRDLPESIAKERALYDQGGRYMYLHAQHVADGQKKLEAAKQLAPELEKQLKDLKQAYHDSGYDDVEYRAFTPGETRIGGSGIERVGDAAVNQGTPAGLRPTGIEVDVITAATVFGPAVLRMGKAVLSRAAASARARLAKPATLKPYNEAGGHHAPAKRAFEGDPNYNPGEALAVPADELARHKVRHPAVTGAQKRLYLQFAKKGERLTWGEVERI